jgi:hypothetical protein
MLRIENLRVEVGGKEILKDVNLEIPPVREDKPDDDDHGLCWVQCHQREDCF